MAISGRQVRLLWVFTLLNLFLLLLVGYRQSFLLLPRVPVARESSASSVPQAAVPVKLRIPALGIEAPIEQVGLTSMGQMGIPSGPDVVGWFNQGYVPGTPGNAVIAGHVDLAGGAPGIFAHLDTLKVGDDIIVEAADGASRTFRIVDSEAYPVDASPMERIFGPSDAARLNLITCSGTWRGWTYSDRLVVYAKAVLP